MRGLFTILAITIMSIGGYTNAQEIAPAIPAAVTGGCSVCGGGYALAGQPYEASLEGRTDTVLKARKGRRIRRHERRSHGASMASEWDFRARDGFGTRRQARINRRRGS